MIEETHPPTPTALTILSTQLGGMTRLLSVFTSVVSTFPSLSRISSNNWYTISKLSRITSSVNAAGSADCAKYS